MRRAGAFLGEGRVEYVWRETGEVGDSKPLFFAIEIDAALLRRLELHDDEDSARAALSG